MKKLSSLFLLICTLLFINCTDTSTEIQDPYKDFDKPTKDLLIELDNNITPINGSELSTDDSDLKFLDEFGNTRIVVLGEATYGTKEFFEMKHRIFKYLVTKFNFNALAIQIDFAASLHLNQYLLTGQGDLDNIIKNVMHFENWKMEEFQNLIMWMREYNLSKSGNQKLLIFGFNCQNKTHYPDMIINYLEKVDPDYLNTIRQILIDLENEHIDHFYHLTSDQKTNYNTFFDSLTAHFISNADDYIAKTSNYEYSTSLQLVNVFKQIFLSNSTRTKNRQGEFMSENHQWILEFIGTGSKIVSWSHNNHVFNIPSENTMGSYFNSEYKNETKIIGFGFSTGDFQAFSYDPQTGTFPSPVKLNKINVEPLNTSTNYLLHNSIHKNYILDFRKLSVGKLFNYFNSQKYFLTIGTGYTDKPLNFYRRLNLTEVMDILIYFDNTNAAVPIQ